MEQEMRWLHRWATIAVIVGAVTAPLHAQRSEGVTASIGIGYGSLATHLSDNAGERVSGSQGAPAGSITLGWAFSDQWRVALQFDQVDETNYLVSQVGSGTEAIATFWTASVAFYPSSRSNFWVRANLGLGRMEFDNENGNGSVKSFAAGLGFGYDWTFHKSPFAAVPYVNYLAIFNTGNFGGALAPFALHGSAGLLQVGIAVGFGN
jgi:hypothetical protein